MSKPKYSSKFKIMIAEAYLRGRDYMSLSDDFHRKIPEIKRNQSIELLHRTYSSSGTKDDTMASQHLIAVQQNGWALK